MNWITILGIIVIAIGTFLTYYGTTKSSSKDKKEITEKIDVFRDQLETIKKEDISQPEKEEQIEKMENEFQTWANKFIQNKEGKSIELKKTELNIQELKVKLNNEWHFLYADLFASLNQMIKAYSKASERSDIVFIENPKLPNNIYDAVPISFKVVVQFDESVFWYIWLKIKEPLNANEIPSIEISISNRKDLDYFYWGDLSIKPEPDQEIIRVVTMNVFEKAGFKEEYPLEKKSAEIKELIKKAFEYQVLLIGK